MTAALARRLLRSERGISAVEFALSLPILLAIGGYGVEMANLALTHLRVSQYALYLADNASRVGLVSPLSTTQMREADVNDIFLGLDLQSRTLKLTTFGRVTLSSLEKLANGNQQIHWQRCIGALNKTGYDSSYGVAPYDDTGKVVTSMGDSWSPVTAPSTSYGVMFVEINYDYQRLFGSTFMGPQKLHYSASYIVRDSRDYSGLFNQGNKTKSLCNVYSSTAPA